MNIAKSISVLVNEPNPSLDSLPDSPNKASERLLRETDVLYGELDKAGLFKVGEKEADLARVAVAALSGEGYDDKMHSHVESFFNWFEELIQDLYTNYIETRNSESETFHNWMERTLNQKQRDIVEAALALAESFYQKITQLEEAKDSRLLQRLGLSLDRSTPHKGNFSMMLRKVKSVD